MVVNMLSTAAQGNLLQGPPLVHMRAGTFSGGCGLSPHLQEGAICVLKSLCQTSCRARHRCT